MGSTFGLPDGLESVIKFITGLLGSTTTVPFGSSGTDNKFLDTFSSSGTSK
ncbi:hypothetical protein GCM10027169_35300 [Gordonia jinhuaensis]|uniref:Uncharacterized protein n=1 Tax=Gordonia jinhuaensis TaxID=1517702 RepID=A0A916WTV1_9ACTN|nr:hypothetical protein [Gordonia jinhuaensis]GGB30049.1 hypothetical protein GCM10011489_17830 [Gordonia jinhuaensis]